MNREEKRIVSALVLAAELMAAADDAWWVIGSAAAWLHGADTEVQDIDILASEADADRLLPAAGCASLPGAADDRFRSRRFGRIALDGMVVEVMAGLHVHDGTGWSAVSPLARVALERGGVRMFAPTREEMIAILHRFDRPKDRARAALLKQMA